MIPTLLATPKVKSDEAIISDLRKYLADAEAGEIESICIVVWRRNGDVKMTGIAEDVTRKIGALTRMIHDLLK